jgi:hypothetical protein
MTISMVSERSLTDKAVFFEFFNMIFLTFDRGRAKPVADFCAGLSRRVTKTVDVSKV